MTDKQRFLYGASISAAQAEGAWNIDGRTPSIWDVSNAERIKGNSNTHSTCDFYHRYKDDIRLFSDIGLNCFRFSISWSRVIPAPGVINERGVRFYSDLVDELLKNGIQPMVTLYHWDEPVWLHSAGGWRNPQSASYFEEYVRVVVDALSDRVSYWIVMNEAKCFLFDGYCRGIFAPFEKSVNLKKLTVNAYKAHARAVDVIRKYAKCKPYIGTSQVITPFNPNETVDKQQAYDKTWNSFIGKLRNSCWVDPLCLGTGPHLLDKGRNDFSDIYRPLDFLGINVYKSMNPENGPVTSMKWEIHPETIYHAIRFCSERYDLPIVITENGMSSNDVVTEEGKKKSVHDNDRIEYLKTYTASVKKAISEGYDVRGYLAWSALDNLEWTSGFEPRFGLIYVDYETQERIVKDSGKVFASLFDSF